MGRKRDQDEQLFVPNEVAPPVKVKRVKDQIWTRNKALLIDRYLRYFVKVTGHGTYVDGFAAPQQETDLSNWSARRVVEATSTDRRRKRLQHFHLFEYNSKRMRFLRQLRDEHNPPHDIQIYRGDFNERVDEILVPTVITPKEATFVLLDQYAFECDWSTVEKLARYQEPRTYRLELFYFLCNWWFNRSKAMAIDKKIRWWGRDDADDFFSITNGWDRAMLMSERFEDLGYSDVKPWAIYSSKEGSGVAYFMIHATDHPRAPVLMRSAYEDAVRPPKNDRQLAMELGVDPDELRD